MNSSALIQKVWNFCHTLRDDGVSYGDYLEQLTYLLFLKLAHTNYNAEQVGIFDSLSKQRGGLGKMKRA
jgi:type I restriction-modification system DNA methylase subunit